MEEGELALEPYIHAGGGEIYMRCSKGKFGF